ncbi:DUF4844 domain-containing protein [Flavihumibacter petaseus]|uniref:DUF4844 domain-containing protein n=1 Tax=Flavihumibacter petaseus NBRC 106054 TaxID=1220578 RepID=A0A0E9N5W7_9BACT|nr:DUF4844 domain-containing protein [Flavihumibacter petaseus]GAO45352.1 hypothetical protein FPE01S_05_00490 [Flavihumibacter petaseus NBRC 106054]
MATDQEKIDQLTAFINREKFSDDKWYGRELNPSARELSSKLEQLFNGCASALIDAINAKASDAQLKKILKTRLSYFNQRDYDTEEKEFICDVFFEIAQILKVDYTDTMRRWLYGPVMATILKLQAVLNPPEVLDTIKLNCSTCGTALDTFIMRKETGIPDFSWNIIQCRNCKDYAMVSYGTNVKEFRHDNYAIVEQLPKHEFTKEQAEIRLEQIRQFRKQ